MKNKKKQLRYFAFAFLLGVMSPVSSHGQSKDELVIIVSMSQKVEKVTRDEIKQIFLKKKTSLKGFGRIIPINAPENTELRTVFRKTVLELSERDEKIYWSEQQIRRQIQPPAEIGNTVKAVFKLKLAISYAFRKSIPNNVVKQFRLTSQSRSTANLVVMRRGRPTRFIFFMRPLFSLVSACRRGVRALIDAD
jgi:hypothetical protein